MSGRRPRRRRGRRLWPVLLAFSLVAVVSVSAYLIYNARSTSSSSPTASKYVILYVNQGNGVVNESNFDSMLSFASSHQFNTVFFQVYRSGSLLFGTDQLTYFVGHAHAARMKIFFSLYFTDSSSQHIPAAIYPLGEDGISLDMSSLPLANQTTLFEDLRSDYSGVNAITSTDLTLPLSPDLLVLETYSPQIEQFSQYIHPGVIASVGVFATTSSSNYQQEVSYALSHSDGVMVFDYARLLKSGY